MILKSCFRQDFFISNSTASRSEINRFTLILVHINSRMVNENTSSTAIFKYHFIKQQLFASLAFEKELAGLLKRCLANIDEGENYNAYTAALTALLANNLIEEEIKSFLPLHGDLKELEALIGTFDEMYVEAQSAERFHSQEGDAALVRFRKFGKRVGLKTGWAVQAFTNVFRKEKKVKVYWRHKIPRASLAEYVYLIKFCALLQPFYAQFLKDREQRIRQFYLLDRELEHHRFLKADEPGSEESLAEIENRLEQTEDDIHRFFAAMEEQLDEEFRELSQIAGTFEFPNRRISAKKLSKEKAKVFQTLDHVLESEQLLLFAIGEHWRLKLQNRTLIFKLEEEVGQQSDILLEQINTKLRPAFINLKKELTGLASGDKSDWDEEELSEVKTFVEKQVPELIQLLFHARLVNVFDRPLVQLEASIRQCTEIHQFAAPVFDERPIRRKSFDVIKTRELLIGSVLGPLKQQFENERKKLLGLVQKVTTSLEEIQYTANYSVDFYISQRANEPAAGELKEGLLRTVKKADEILAYLASLSKLVEDVFTEQGQIFAEQVLQYFEPHRLHTSVKLNQRREAAARRKIFIQQTVKKTVSLAKHYFHLLKELHSAFYHKYFNLKSLLGISYAAEPISTELSNYLTETKQAIGRLPLMYQKLYENVPLSEERFYIPRKAELQRLGQAYTDWQERRFAPVCLVGEQGSGTTTIFNFFEQSVSDKYETIRLELGKNKVADHEFFELLRSLSAHSIVTNIDELIEHINSSSERKVVFLENIHNLFLRNSGDFGNLFLLFKLISQTNQRIFWVTSCYLYSWKLLNYTNSISSYFAHVVEFSPLSSAQIRELILKRHQLSGFSLHFAEPDNFSPKRNYQKMDDEEKQSLLKDVFFENLEVYAQSNLRLAFIYWLRAISKVENGEISIRQKRLDFSFLNSLKTQEQTTLHSILIHGGYGVKEHSRIFRCSTEASFRMLMVLTDDGLLEKQDDQYLINPLVYRMLVSQLKSLNFIY